MAKKHVTVKDMPEEERPRERLARVGPQALSTMELLAILLRVGVNGENVLNLAARILSELGDLEGLAHADFAQLIAVHGLGPAKAAQLLAALELGRRVMMAAPQERDQINMPAKAARILQALIGHQEQEHFVVLYLDTRNHILDSETLYKGSLNTSLVRVAEVFRGAVRRNCAAIIVGHNHPSGNPEPSPEDITLTRRLVEAGKLLEIELLDHIVVGYNRYVSLRERGTGFESSRM